MDELEKLGVEDKEKGEKEKTIKTDATHKDQYEFTIDKESLKLLEPKVKKLLDNGFVIAVYAVKINDFKLE